MSPPYQTEIEKLRDQCARSGRSLERSDVVDYARNHPKSETWKAFNERGLWDDAKAAEEARLLFASQIVIRCRATLSERPAKEARVFVHLDDPANTSDRTPGYETTEDVLNDPERRVKLIETVINRARGNLLSYPIKELDWALYGLDVTLAKVQGVRPPAPPSGSPPAGWVVQAKVKVPKIPKKPPAPSRPHRQTEIRTRN